MEDQQNKFLRNEDLILLLNQYKNTIEMNSILIKQQENIITKQKSLCEATSNLVNELLKFKENRQQFSHEIQLQYKDGKTLCESAHKLLANEIKTSQAELEKKIVHDHTNLVDEVKENQSKLSLRLSGGLAIFGSISAFLIWFIIEMTKHFEKIDAILLTLDRIG